MWCKKLVIEPTSPFIADEDEDEDADEDEVVDEDEDEDEFDSIFLSFESFMAA